MTQNHVCCPYLMWPYRSYRLLEVEVVFKLDVVVHLLGILGDAMKGYIENIRPELVIAQWSASNLIITFPLDPSPLFWQRFWQR